MSSSAGASPQAAYPPPPSPSNPLLHCWHCLRRAGQTSTPSPLLSSLKAAFVPLFPSSNVMAKGSPNVLCCGEVAWWQQSTAASCSSAPAGSTCSTCKGQPWACSCSPAAAQPLLLPLAAFLALLMLLMLAPTMIAAWYMLLPHWLLLPLSLLPTCGPSCCCCCCWPCCDCSQHPPPCQCTQTAGFPRDCSAEVLASLS